ncbi:MAG: hypothetical protein V1723_01650 [Candidatus Uhrbacteria bacterium]
MSPHHRLWLGVVSVAALIAVAWFVLFRRGLLGTPVVPTRGPSLLEISRQFDAAMEQYREVSDKLTPQIPTNNAPPATTDSDDIVK